uniref:UDP-glycosyltransferases domain-containing protein n=1 Tax=Fagus sylvatica TaxID=28930 RepID=A0A2N9GT36_FAGSY
MVEFVVLAVLWYVFSLLEEAGELGKLIARKGHHVSFISTPRNIERLPKIPPDVTPLITLVKLPLPHVENLPENAEATADVPHHIIPFFWALRKRSGSVAVELPEGFVERTKNRGVVWTDWAPQLRILAHESVGGFLSHCGWSSVIEALEFGRALIMLPFLVDQGLIARFLEEKQTAIEIPRNEEDGSFSRDSVAQTLTLVMKDEEGKIYRDKAKEMSTIFADEDLQYRYIDKFVEFLEHQSHVHR